MPLEPAVEQLLAGLAALPAVDLTTVTPPELRASMKALAPAGDAPVVPARASTAGGVPVRIYEPPGADPAGPALVWFHGGGWVIGDLDTTDGTVRRLAAATGLPVVSVDYRLAPEHPFPAAVDDCLAAYEAIADRRWVAVGGDSAGGNLAAVVALSANRKPDFQLLVYPVIDATQHWPSKKENAEGYLLTTATMDWFEANYVTDEQRSDPRVSPILAPSLEGAPPAYVITAGFDPLRDEGEAYVERLRDAGVPVEAVRYDGQIHGFFGTPDLFGPTAQTALDAAARALRDAAG